MLPQGNTTLSCLMAQPSPIVQQPPAAVEQALTRLGRDIRTARLRRNWRLDDLAARMGVSRFTVADVERGKPGTSAAAYLGALWALGLLDQLSPVADPDHDSVGKTLEAARAPRVARRADLLDDDF
jgi:ribosome-binding protein aMBF1 (putative translation factor)